MTRTLTIRPINSVHKALTCPEGQIALEVVPSLTGEKKLAECKECIVENPGCCLVLVCVLWLFSVAEVQPSNMWEKTSGVSSSSMPPSSWSSSLVLYVGGWVVVGEQVVQRLSAIITACVQSIQHFLMTHDVVPIAAKKSSALRVARQESTASQQMMI